MNKPIRIADVEILQMAGFIDVLEVIENYDDIKEVKKDIKFRKKLMKKEIKMLEKNNKNEYYCKKEVYEVLRGIQMFLQRNEWSYAKDYIEIVMNEMSNNVEKP